MQRGILLPENIVYMYLRNYQNGWLQVSARLQTKKDGLNQKLRLLQNQDADHSEEFYIFLGQQSLNNQILPTLEYEFD